MCMYMHVSYMYAVFTVSFLAYHDHMLDLAAFTWYNYMHGHACACIHARNMCAVCMPVTCVQVPYLCTYSTHT